MVINRRHFLRSVCVGCTGIMGTMSGSNCMQNQSDFSIHQKGENTSKVVTSHRSDMRIHGNSVSGDAVKKMVDTAVENLFGVKNIKVWQTLFSPDDIVGLKVNCLAGKGLSTHPDIVNSVVENLLSVGVPKRNIIVWDRMNRDLERAGYNIYYGSKKVQYYGNDQSGYTREIFEFGSAASLVSRILHNQCTAVINLPILKDHGIVGISMALKNFFGAINNPNKYHDNFGNPYVADVNMFSDIKNKTRLTICDALTPQYEGGPPYMPQWTWQMDSVIAAVDMVAMDYYGLQIIDQQRLKNGFKSLKETGREPYYIFTASDNQHKLGTSDPEKIQIINV